MSTTPQRAYSTALEGERDSLAARGAALDAELETTKATGLSWISMFDIVPFLRRGHDRSARQRVYVTEFASAKLSCVAFLRMSPGGARCACALAL